MPRWLLLILGVLVLFLAPSLVLKAVYGRSYEIVPSDNCWVPDGQNGWEAKGFPIERRPQLPSENVPFLLKVMPIVFPFLLILLFLLSPLAQYLDREPDYRPGKYQSEKYQAKFVEISTDDKTEID